MATAASLKRSRRSQVTAARGLADWNCFARSGGRKEKLLWLNDGAGGGMRLSFSDHAKRTRSAARGGWQLLGCTQRETRGRGRGRVHGPSLPPCGVSLGCRGLPCRGRAGVSWCADQPGRLREQRDSSWIKSSDEIIQKLQSVCTHARTHATQRACKSLITAR